MKAEMAALAADLFEIPYQTLMGRSRVRRVTLARFALCRALKMRGMSHAAIAKFVERDRASVIHALRVAEYMVKYSPEYAEKVQRIANYTPVLVTEKDEETGGWTIKVTPAPPPIDYSWKPAHTAPEGVVVMTKIDDEKGEREIAPLRRMGRTWFLPEDNIYVYYKPTHWKPICPDQPTDT